MRFAVIAFAVSALVAGCDLAEKTGCVTEADCVSGNVCVSGECVTCTDETLGCPCSNPGGYCGTSLICTTESVCAASCNDGVVDPMLDGCDGNAPANAQCTDTCTYVCNAGFADCNGEAADGCECVAGTLATMTSEQVSDDDDGELNRFTDAAFRIPGPEVASLTIRLVGQTHAASAFGATLDGADAPHSFLVDYDVVGDLGSNPTEPEFLSALQLGGTAVAAETITIDEALIQIDTATYVGGSFRVYGTPPDDISVGFGLSDGFVAGPMEGTPVVVVQAQTGRFDRVLSLDATVNSMTVFGGVVCANGSVDCQSATFDVPAPGSVSRDLQNLSDGFVGVFDSRGNIGDVVVIGGLGEDRVVEVEALHDSTSFVAIGDFEGEVAFQGSDEVLSNEPSMFIARYAANTTASWALAPTVGAGGAARAVDLVVNRVNGVSERAHVLVWYRGALVLGDLTLEAAPDNGESLALVTVDLRAAAEERVLGASAIAHGSFYAGNDGLAIAALGYDGDTDRLYAAVNVTGATDIYVAHGTAPQQTPERGTATIGSVEAVDIVYGRLNPVENAAGFAWHKRTSGPGTAVATTVLATTEAAATADESVFLAGGIQGGEETFGAGEPGAQTLPARSLFIARFDSE